MAQLTKLTLTLHPPDDAADQTNNDLVPADDAVDQADNDLVLTNKATNQADVDLAPVLATHGADEPIKNAAVKILLTEITIKTPTEETTANIPVEASL